MSQALGTLEPTGRVRARGRGITPKIFFKKPSGGMRQLQEEQIKFQKETVSRFKSKLNEQQQQLQQDQDLRFKQQEERIRELEVKFSDTVENLADNIPIQEGTAETLGLGNSVDSILVNSSLINFYSNFLYEKCYLLF